MSIAPNIFERRALRTDLVRQPGAQPGNSNLDRAIALLRVMLAAASLWFLNPAVALGASASEINRNATAALSNLYRNTHGAGALADKSKGILIFPTS